MKDAFAVRVHRVLDVPIEVVVFAAAGLCTCSTVLAVVFPALATIVSMMGGLLTLAGLFILGLGAHDERPLRRLPAARTLLLVAAVAGAAQTTALHVQAPVALRTTLEQLIVPGTGVAGGLAIGAATVLLATRRTRHNINLAVFCGLVVITVGALVTNWTALLAGRTLLSAELPVDTSAILTHLSVIGSGVGQLVIAYGLSVRTGLGTAARS